MQGSRRALQDEKSAHVTERLRPYLEAKPTDDEESPRVEILDELMARVLMLLNVMPRNQSRKTIEELVSPHEHMRGRRAVNALIEAGLVSEDDGGHLRRLH